MIPVVQRAFLLKASKAWTKAVKPREIAVAGRLDVVARTLMAALVEPYRRFTLFMTVLEGPPKPPLLLMVDGSKAHVPGSEEEFARIYSELIQGGTVNGYQVKRSSFRETVNMARRAGYNVYYLYELGNDIRGNFKLVLPALFILGDHLGLTSKEEKWLFKSGIRGVSIGPISYFASHCILIVHEEISRRYPG